ncbi:hypothetical protein CR492_03320 [Methylocella silvestris]|uniref:Uncharacterized protein n=1 Tax=Methylocella silvestris TaxID=199596 RepID=A0A2J7TMC4_METSI|nr:hypothetical protein CR492_03320 [Methylocella silvestris]
MLPNFNAPELFGHVSEVAVEAVLLLAGVTLAEKTEKSTECGLSPFCGVESRLQRRPPPAQSYIILT